MSKQLASLYCITPKGKLFLCFLERIGYMSHINGYMSYINDFVDKICLPNHQSLLALILWSVWTQKGRIYPDTVPYYLLVITEVFELSMISSKSELQNVRLTLLTVGFIYF